MENMTPVTSTWHYFNLVLTVPNTCRSFITSVHFFLFFPPGYTVEVDVPRTHGKLNNKRRLFNCYLAHNESKTGKKKNNRAEDEYFRKLRAGTRGCKRSPNFKHSLYVIAAVKRTVSRDTSTVSANGDYFDTVKTLDNKWSWKYTLPLHGGGNGPC